MTALCDDPKNRVDFGSQQPARRYLLAWNLMRDISIFPCVSGALAVKPSAC